MNKEDYNALSIKEFSRRNGIGRTTVYKEIKEGRLRTKKVGRRRLISCEEERRWFAQDVLIHGERHHD
jgi:excisionase family DNA binding protein